MNVSVKTSKIDSKHNLTFSNVFEQSQRNKIKNFVSIGKKLNLPYYDRVTGGLSEEEIAQMPIRGYCKCDMNVDSYFALIVAKWVDDETIIPFGQVGKYFYWGNSEVVFWSTVEELLRIKEEVERDGGYSGQLSCFSWQTIRRVYYQCDDQFLPFYFALTKEMRKEFDPMDISNPRRG